MCFFYKISYSYKTDQYWLLKIKLIFNRETNLDYLIDYTKQLNEYEISYNDSVLKNEIKAKVDDYELIIHEKELVLGIGCKKGKSLDDLLNGLKIALNDLNLPIKRINTISTGEMKKDEKGIIDLSNNLNIPLKFVSLEKLKLFKSNITSESEFVKSKFGIDGVSEQSSMIIAGYDSKLIYKKTAFNGVTIAFSISK